MREEPSPHPLPFGMGEGTGATASWRSISHHGLHPGIEQFVSIAMFGRADAGRFPAAERERYIRAGRWGVELDDAGVDFPEEFFLQRGGPGKQRRCQPVPYAVA